MKNKTVFDLVNFCKETDFTEFDSQKTGYRIHVSVPATFTQADNSDNADDDYDPNEGLMRIKILVMHTGLNANGSYISKEVAEKAMKSFKNRPILAYIHKLKDGTYDFYEHNAEKYTDKAGNEQIKYIEVQVGSITDDEPWFEHNEENDWDDVYCYGVIPREYTKAADIIESKDGTTVSCELSINSFTWNKETKYIDFKSLYMSAVTLLGCDDKGREFDPGMEGAHADIVDFSENDSPISHYVSDPKIIDAIINGVVNGISNKFSAERKEVEKKVNKLDELLKKYNKTVEDLTFDYKDMKDDELEAKFEEVFAAKPVEQTAQTEAHTEAPTEDPKPVDTKVTYFVKDGDTEIALFSLNAEDTIVKLERLARQKFGNDLYVFDIYPETHEFVFGLWTDEGRKTFRADYSIDDSGAYSLGENAVEVHAVYLTDEEDKAVDSMKANFTKLQDEVDQYKKKEDDVKKTALLSAKKYSYIADTDEVKALQSDENKAEFDKMTSEELETKMNNLLIKYADEGKLTFAKTNEEPKAEDHSGVKLFPFAKPMENSRYGGLFNK